MAAASLDLNFKEELSAIEQCKFLSMPHNYVPSDTRFIKGSKFCRKQSAQPLSIVFFNIRLKSKFGFSSPFFSRWLGPILCLLSSVLLWVVGPGPPSIRLAHSEQL